MADSLFTSGTDQIDFDLIASGSYEDGTQYHAQAGDDDVTLPSTVAAAAVAGYLVGSTFFGGAGNDTITGDGLDDAIDGGEGSDTLTGGAGADVLAGGADADLLLGGSGSDLLQGGAGNDVIEGGEDDDNLEGNSGNDTLRGGDGADTLTGGADADLLIAGAGNDVVAGDGGDDVIEGGAGDDTIDGGDGDDAIDGGDGDDFLFGGEGNDVLVGDGGLLRLIFEPGRFDEFRVNSTTRSHQDSLSIDGLANGGYVVVWESANNDGDRDGVFGQRYDASGLKVGSEFRTNTRTYNHQHDPDVAGLTGGGFVVVWESKGQEDDEGVYGQLYNANGSKSGGEFRVNSTTANNQKEPEVEALSDGGYVVVWNGQGTGDGSGVFARVYNSEGSAQGSEFRINTTTSSTQERAEVSAFDDGGFVVVWESRSGDEDGRAIFAQRYDNSGAKIGSETLVNTTTAGNQRRPDVSTLDDGGFVVVWQSPDGAENGVFYQIFDSNGVASGAERRANSTTAGNQDSATVASLPDGGFIIAWESDEQDGADEGIFSQRFDAGGNAVAGEVQINDTAARDQACPDIATLEDGSVIIGWDSNGQDGSGKGVFAKHFELTTNAAGADTLLGGGGDDVLIGGAGNDVLDGGADADTLMGGTGDDDLSGGDGNDLLIGGDIKSHALEINALDPVSVWRLEETSGGTAIDSTGTQNGAFHNNVSLGGEGISATSKASSFDGSNDFVEIAHNPAFALASGSVQAWFNTDSASTNQTILSRDSSGFDAGGHLNIKINSNGRVEVRLQNAVESFTVNSANESVSAGQWHHVVFAWGNGGMKLYLDGTLVDTDAFTGGIENNSEPLTLGASQVASGNGTANNLREFFNGEIDEVALFGRGLTDAEVTQLFTSGAGTQGTATGDGTLNGGAGADQLDGGDGTDVASYVGSSAAVTVNLATGRGVGGDAEGDTLVDIENLIGSANADTLIGDGAANRLEGRDGDDVLIGGAGADRLDGDGGTDTASYSGSTAGVTVNLATGVNSGGDTQGDVLENIENLIGSAEDDTLTGDGAANRIEGGVPSHALEVTALNPISFWRMEETSGSIANDSAGDENGSYKNGPELGESGISGESKAASFDGSNDFVEIAHDSAFELASGSVQMWFNTNEDREEQGIFSKDSSGFDTGGHMTATLKSNGSVEVRLQSTTESFVVKSGAEAVGENEWHHVVFTWGTGGMKLFLDGTLVDTNGFTGGLEGNFEPIAIGASTVRSGNLTTSGANRFFDGEIDEVAIFGDQLSAAQASQLFASGPGSSAATNDTLDGGEGTDTIDLTGAGGLDLSAGWTITLSAGAIESIDSGVVTLADGSDGTISVTGGPTFSFVDIEQIAFTGPALTVSLAGVTLNGGSGSDVLIGGAGSDAIDGNGGNDYIAGRADADFLDGDSGEDHILGELGNDTIEGGSNDDYLNGGAGNDTLDGESGNDLLLGGAGNDILEDSPGENMFDGEAGNDTITGGSGEEVLLGGTGNDVLNGGGEEDSLFGGEDDDVLHGDSGNDHLFGDAGSDALFGDDGHDLLDGGTGNDLYLFREGGGDDIFVGGSGFDSLHLAGQDGGGFGPGAFFVSFSGSQTGSGSGFIDFAEGASGVIQLGDASTITFSEIERIKFDPNSASFSGGSIKLADADGSTISTGSGEDHIIGGAGNEAISTSSNEDLAVGKAGDDAITGGSDIDVFSGGAGNDTLSGGSGDDRLLGDAGDDLLEGGNNDDFLFGDTGADTINAGDGDDFLFGGTGDDILQGGKNEDVIDGGAGSDTADYSDASSGVNVDLSVEGLQTVGGGRGVDTLVEIENLTGSSSADSLTGNRDANAFTGGDGNDAIDGGLGSDVAIFTDNLLDAGTAIGVSGGNIVVTTAAGDTDTLISIESLRFGDFADVRVVGNGAGAHFATIQAAIDGVGANTALFILNGTYEEQVVIDKSVTLIGQSEAGVILRAPASQASETLGVGSYSKDVSAALLVNSSASNWGLRNLTVDGADRMDYGTSSQLTAGIAIEGAAGGIINNVTVDNVTDGALKNIQDGVGILGYFESASDSLTITNSTIQGFNKNGLSLSGGNLTITNNQITGAGLTGTVAQNGIQITTDMASLDSAVGTISGNTISGVAFSGSSTVATSIVMFGDGSPSLSGLTVENNTIVAGNSAIFNNAGAVVQNNEVSSFDAGVKSEITYDGWSTDGLTVIGGNTTDDTMFTDEGDDVISGLGGNDYIDALDGNDVIDGGAGNDDIYAGTGDDILIGGAGDDFLDGEGGNDTFTGGSGEDTFDFNEFLLGDVSVITDFETGSNADQLDLEELLVDDLGYSGSDAVGDGFLRFVQSESDTRVEIDADGAAGAAFDFALFITLENVLPSQIVNDNLVL